MKRAELLVAVSDAVLVDRAATHGGIEDTFGRIADLWTAYLSVPVDEHDVAMLMVLLKVARASVNPAHADNHVDIAGYAACAAELVELASQPGATPPPP